MHSPRSGRTAAALFASLLGAASFGTPLPALAFGDDGHQVVALIADQYLTPVARARIEAILKNDSEPFTMRDGRKTNSSFATQANWADYYRESQGRSGDAYRMTHEWHFADIEIDNGLVAEACSWYPPLPLDVPASEGAPDECVIDKITQFAAELASPSTPDAERLKALKFVMHFVGDIHQPLHASDDHDAGGNLKMVSAAGFKDGRLHSFWDTEFVLRIGPNADAIAKLLLPRITATERRQWSTTDPKRWAIESFTLGKRFAYGALPKPTPGADGAGLIYKLGTYYVDTAIETTGLQLSKAGVRLAALLNEVLR